MPEYKKNNFQFLQSSLIVTPHAMFNKNGGVSKNHLTSLNTSFYVSDNHDSVIQNREIIKKQLGINTLISAKQTHSDTIVSVTTNDGDIEFPDCDSLITSQPGIGLLIQHADCQAILIHDPARKIIAAIHCGWRGSVLNIIKKTISRITNEYSSDPADFRCVISPSLGPCCSEFVNFRKELPAEFYNYQIKPQYFDFWKISREQLQKAGVPGTHIETVAQCTVCNDEYFSYRRSRRNNRDTGRNGSVIALPM